jgi:rhodanese-related sulfurtransferase
MISPAMRLPRFSGHYDAVVADGDLELPPKSLGAPGGATRRTDASMSFNDISLDDLKKGLGDGSILLVDVREAEEYAAGHIKGALFNPLSKFEPSKLPVATEGKRVVIYCRSGRRSVTAMEQARLFGRRDVNTHFGGGILAWLNAQQPVETAI